MKPHGIPLDPPLPVGYTGTSSAVATHNTRGMHDTQVYIAKTIISPFWYLVPGVYSLQSRPVDITKM